MRARTARRLAPTREGWLTVTPTARAIRCWRYLAGVSLPGRANRPRTFPLNSALRLSVQAFRIGSTRVRAKVVRPLAALRWRRIRAVRLVDVSDEACPLRIKRVQLGQQPRIPLSQRPFAQSGICNKREYPERAEAGASFETPARTFRCPVCVTAVREAAAIYALTTQCRQCLRRHETAPG